MGWLPDVRWSVRIARGLSLGSLCLLATAPSIHSAVYACTEPSGVTVITDSPAQLRDCTLISSTPSTKPPPPDPAPEPRPQHASEHEALPRAQPQAAPLSIPLERVGSLLVVTVQVNGTRPAKMILDTGASHTILSFAVARDLSLWAQHRSTSMTMHTAGGTVQTEVLPIASMTIGDAEVTNVEAAIYDLPEAPPGIEGLLGLNVLGQFTVTLDAVRNRLLLGAQP